MQTKSMRKKDGIFFNLLLLTSFLMLLEISYFIQCNRVYLSDFTFVSKNLSIPITIVPGILYFLCAQIAVHLFYCFCIWAIVELIAGFIQLPAAKKNIFSIWMWSLGVITILTANQNYFPNSKFSELTSLLLFNQTITEIACAFLFGCCSLVILLALFAFIGLLIRRKQLLLTIIIILAAAPLWLFIQSGSKSSSISVTASRPNIILVGVDSLRPDFLSYFGSERLTPFFDSFLKQSSVFGEAVTPLARTFPSWSSILTGQYPRQINIRSNLADHSRLNFKNTLPSILQRNGYETIYATDETRFSNIDKDFGFNHIISPSMGLNDFLVGNFNDFPMTNLVVNTTIGKWLFPHSYANRPVHFTYDPNSFLNMLSPTLERKRNQPLFLAVHFCITHAPYLWANLSGQDLSPQERYVKSIERVDQQLSDFFALLKQNHLLDHAIVVLLSDHGEALEFPGDRITEKDLYVSSPQAKTSSIPKFYPPGLDNEEINQSAGHGTDVLGLPQYHTLLAFKLYGVEDYKAGNVSGVVTLIDIKPTILDFLKLPAPDSSGISLVNFIKDQAQTVNLRTRHIFLESDFSPEAIRTVFPEERKVLLEGIDIFQINPTTTRLTVKDSMTAKIINSKQYADIYDDWMLALYPQNQNIRMPILINLNTGMWTNDLQTEFAQHSPAQLMLAELRAFYGKEISRVSSER